MFFKNKKRGLENLIKEILNHPKVSEQDKDLIKRGSKIPQKFNPFTGEIIWKTNQDKK